MLSISWFWLACNIKYFLINCLLKKEKLLLLCQGHDVEETPPSDCTTLDSTYSQHFLKKGGPMDTLHYRGTTHTSEDSAGTLATLNTTRLQLSRFKELDPTTGPGLTPTVTQMNWNLF